MMKQNSKEEQTQNILAELNQHNTHPTLKLDKNDRDDHQHLPTLPIQPNSPSWQTTSQQQHLTKQGESKPPTTQSTSNPDTQEKYNNTTRQAHPNTPKIFLALAQELSLMRLKV